jgi:hypothetical protein
MSDFIVKGETFRHHTISSHIFLKNVFLVTRITTLLLAKEYLLTAQRIFGKKG